MNKKTPDILYKYRNWTAEFEKRTITHREFYLANPNSFTDEYDCSIPLDFESVTTEQIQKRYFEFSKKNNPDYSRAKHRAFARSWTKKGLLKNKNRVKEIESEYFEIFDKLSGVLSLTGFPNLMRMWEEYASDHQGFCIGIKSKYMLENSDIFGSCGPVIYDEKLPSISPLYDPNQKIKSFTDQVFRKLTKWDFENEYRFFKIRKYGLSNQERKIMVDPEAISEIILGSNMIDTHKEEIRNIAKKELPFTSIFQAEINNDRIQFKDL
ncbi:DUF2971 domain-containing protein [Marivirga sp. S37H4]|uniref:DUF2971 domain-containing protein n=1 Tax=Marivirga aurantiaca TaxID=2802615 RepID=A0A935CDN0_9BACT|nr:DUF2971 domain-containing protein [Marivirga aurantiaca]MBK6267088.1 DUF2971 domain-containing protein [Marivirga aurantiaca]